jgi:hypothetical protein
MSRPERDYSGNLEPASKYQRPRHLVSWWGLIIGLILGVGSSLYYAWNVSPVVQYDTDPWQLRSGDKTQYVVAITLDFASDSNLQRAADRLLSLRLGNDPFQEVANMACELATTGYVDSTSGLRAVRSMITFYQLQGKSGCADTLIPIQEEATAVVEIEAPTPTLAPPPSKTPTPESAVRPSPTPPAIVVPTSIPQRDFVLADINTFCDADLSGIIEVFVQDFGSVGIPGQQVRVRWDDGEDTFFTGLKPERGPGYADFQMEANQGYIIEMPGRSEPSAQPLTAIPCTTESGASALISYRVFFLPAE